MQIQTTNQYILQKKTNFKSVYPVYHWVSDMGGEYSLATTRELNKTLNRTTVRLANYQKNTKNQTMCKIAHRFQKFLKIHDLSFRKIMKTRSFYHENQAYLITGHDVAFFNYNYGAPIGKSKSIENKENSEELNIALNNYYIKGLDYVKNKSNRFCDRNKQCYALHTQFDTIRDKNGNITGYKLVDACYLPVADMQTSSDKINSFFSSSN